MKMNDIILVLHNHIMLSFPLELYVFLIGHLGSFHGEDKLIKGIIQ